MFAPPARKTGTKLTHLLPEASPHAVTAEQRPKLRPCKQTTDPEERNAETGLTISKYGRLHTLSRPVSGPTCRRVADTGQPSTRGRQVYVSMYLSAPKMERTHCGRGIDIKQRQGIEQITIYTGRTDDWTQSTLSHLQSGSQTQTSPTG